MRRYWSVVLLLAAVCWMPSQAGAVPRIPPAAVPRSITSLHTDGQFVVWAARETERYDAPYAITALDLGTGEHTTVASGLADLFSPGGSVNNGNLALDNGTVVWVEAQASGAAVRARNLRGGETITVATGDVRLPSIAGSLVTWWEVGDPGDHHFVLRGRDIGTMDAPRTLAESSVFVFGLGPSQTSVTWVAWAVGTSAAKASACWTLYVVPVTGGDPRQIADLSCGLPKFDLYGDTISYLSRSGYVARVTLPTLNVTQRGPQCQDTGQDGVLSSCGDIDGFAVDDRYAFWSKVNRATPGAIVYDLWGYDPVTDSAFMALPGAPQPVNNAFQPVFAARGGWLIAAVSTENDGAQLWTMRVIDTLPAAFDETATGKPNYFPLTGQTLRGAFLAYWQRNGGLPVFGYPLTKEFIQKPEGAEHGYTVQFVERQRFEYHPENTNTPYAVLLGRLGAEALTQRGIDWQTLPKAASSTPHYYAATGQAIAPEFWDYWRTHGLELGDRDVSEREALALWGYPITPPQRETLENGETLLVQWFERARFEFHPDNPTPYKVLLGRLAADTLVQYGWLSQ